MMEVEKPWEFKEEVDIMEEDDAGALLTRERKNKAADLLNEPNNSFNEEPAAEEEEAAGAGAVLLQNQEEEEEQQEQEQKQSVFFDSTNDNGTEPSTEQEATKVEQSSCEKENENESAEGKELEKQEYSYSQENNKSDGNDKLENGLHSNGVQEASNSSETTADGEAGPKLIATIVESTTSLANRSGALDISNRTQVQEIEVEKDENDIESKLNVEEYDLEKILDEQETHDLYCPNCKSCITRRVILRKRKRTVRQALRDEPPKKPQIAQPSADVSNQMAAQGAPEVFRCLSCFTFFIPAGCGFNIFRIFERRDMNQQLEFQHPSASHGSENCGSWLLSCFQTVDSPKKSADADPAKDPLLSGSQITSDIHAQITSDIHATNGKTQVSKKPSVDGSSSTAQQFHGTTSSTVAVQTSSSTTSTLSFSQSKTGVMQTEARGMVTGQQDLGRQEQIPLSEPGSDALTDDIRLDRKQDVPQNTAAATSDGKSFFNQEFFSSEFKFPSLIPPKVLPEVNPSSQKPTPVIPAPVQSESRPDVIVPIIPSDILPTPVPASAQRDEWDILKAIVYGGLVESITSLSVVSAAAASGAKTLDIFILGIANLIGGLPIIFHNIADLRNLGDANENDEGVGHYWLQLGRPSKYRIHMVIAVISYILFGLLPPVIYGLSFRKSDNRENKMMVVAAASLACIALLAMGKAHVKRPRTYFTTLLYYLSLGLSASGLSYVAGVLITRILAHFGLIDQGGSAPSAAPAPPVLLLPDAMGAGAIAWASY